LTDPREVSEASLPGCGRLLVQNQGGSPTPPPDRTNISSLGTISCLELFCYLVSGIWYLTADVLGSFKLRVDMSQSFDYSPGFLDFGVDT
jgi:hypothetical protein